MADYDESDLIPLRERGEENGCVFSSSVDEVEYPFSVKGKCLSGPPPPASRWSFLGYLAQKLGGNFCYEPEDMVGSNGTEDCPLSNATQQLLRERVFNDLDPQDVMDYHCHLVGHGDSGSQCYMHQSLKTWWYPLRRLKSVIFMGAAQVTSMEGGDIQYISRLLRLSYNFVPKCCTSTGSSLDSDSQFLHGRLCLLPFDKFVDPLTGEEDDNRTTFSIPNEYSLMLAREFPDLFFAFGSVNPYRKDSVKRLQHLSELGVNVIKWLPNSMGIDPSDERIEPFYNKMKELNMILLVHCGEEHTVSAAYINNDYGNPLLLRRALNCGVKVITAHCASEGVALDLDRGGGQYEPCFDLWLRLMREEQYKGLLFGDISAICAFLRVPYLHRLIQETDIHDRLVYGSDYPVPAINVVVHTSRLVRYGLITAEEKRSLDELYHYNPLLFDLSSKRLLRGPNGEQFPAEVFKTHPSLPPVAEK